VGEKPSAVKVHLSGLSTDLGRISPAEMPVLVDLARLTPGRHRLTVTAANLKLPRGIRLLAAEPPAVELTLRALRHEELPVAPRLVGRLPAGLRLASAVATPGRLSALVPADGDAKRALRLETAPIDLGAIDQTTSVTRDIVAPPGVLPAGDPWPEVKVKLTVHGRRGRR
jgi:YbbR domain-containing protein